jgi:hypothetical protein
VSGIIVIESHWRIEVLTTTDRPVTYKYQPLAAFLGASADAVTRHTLTFKQIELILGSELPQSAHDHQAWWANETGTDSTHASQLRGWRDVGWRANVDLQRHSVTFERATS